MMYFGLLVLGAILVLSTGCGGAGLSPSALAGELSAPVLLEVGQGDKVASGPPVGIHLSWTRNTEPGVQGYYLYRDTQSIPEPPPHLTLPPELRTNGGGIIGQPAAGPAVLFNDLFNIVIGQRYYYRVTVVDENGHESYPSNEMSWLTHGHTVDSFSPDGVFWGDLVTLTGDTFGTHIVGTDKVLFTGPDSQPIEAAIFSWDDTEIQVIVPNESRTAPVYVSVNGIIAATDEPLTILHPFIGNITPEVGFVEQSLLINGGNFGDSILTATGIVRIGALDVTSAVTTWTDSQLTLIVPANVAAGNVTFEVDGRASNGRLFRPRAEIQSLASDEVVTGTEIGMNGRFFGVPQGTVLLGGVSLSVLEWTDTFIRAVATGVGAPNTLRVHTAGGIESNTVGIVIEDTFSITIAGIDPAHVYTPSDPPPITIESSRDLGDVNYFVYARIDTTTTRLIARSDPANPDALPALLSIPVQFIPNGQRSVFLTVERAGFTAESNSLPVLIHSLSGDIDGDGAVTQADRDMLQSLIGLSEADANYRGWFDTDGDGVITEADLSAVGYNFGQAIEAPSFP